MKRIVLFEDGNLKNILDQKKEGADRELTIVNVEQGFAGVCYKDGEYMKTLAPGQYLLWKHMGRAGNHFPGHTGYDSAG